MLFSLSGMTSFIDAASELDETAFRDLAVDILAKHRPDLEVEVHDIPDVITVAGHTFPLDNIYTEVLTYEPKDRPEMILWYFDSQMENLKKVDAVEQGSFADARDHIMIQLVGLGDSPTEYPSDLVIPFSTGTGLAYIVDTGVGMMYLRREHVARWAVPLTDVHDAAMVNLDAKSKDIDLQIQTLAGENAPMAYCEIDDGYAAARLLSTAFHHRLLGMLGAKVYIGAPNRDFLAAWSDDASDAGKRQYASNILEDSIIQPYPKSANLFVLTASGLREASTAEYLAHGRNSKAEVAA